MVVIANLFDDPQDEVRRELQDRQKRILAASRVGSPGKISTLMGYAGNVADNPAGLNPFTIQ